jgi:hypothetical protein
LFTHAYRHKNQPLKANIAFDRARGEQAKTATAIQTSSSKFLQNLAKQFEQTPPNLIQ